MRNKSSAILLNWIVFCMWLIGFGILLGLTYIVLFYLPDPCAFAYLAIPIVCFLSGLITFIWSATIALPPLRKKLSVRLRKKLSARRICQISIGLHALLIVASATVIIRALIFIYSEGNSLCSI